MRNLDLVALRSFVAVADAGGVTRAAKLLNLTQSAVSMQMKRLEEMLDESLLDRSGRQVALTGAGELLLGYARQMLQLNDAAVGRLMDAGYEGTLTLGVPHDIVYPHIPGILSRFNAEFPRMRVQLVSSYTLRLRAMFKAGECDLAMATEDACGPDGQTLAMVPLVWIGAPGGDAWRRRPLPLGFEPNCLFRAAAVSALDAAGIPWAMAVEAESSRTIEASLSADLVVQAVLAGSEPPYLEAVPHGGDLPALPSKQINLYTAPVADSLPRQRLAEMIRLAYAPAQMRAA